MIHRSLPQRRGQRGISLIVSLVLLVMVTVCMLLYRTFRHNHWL